MPRWRTSGCLSLNPADRVRLGVLATPLTLSAWLPSDPRVSAGIVRPLIERAGPEPSPLWDATHVAIEALAGETAPKMIVILSDGRSNANVRGLDDVADRALTAGVAISVVSEGGERLLAQGADAAARIRPDASLEWLADQTGGVFVPDGVARRSLRPQQDPFAYVRELVQTPEPAGTSPHPGDLSVTTALPSQLFDAGGWPAAPAGGAGAATGRLGTCQRNDSWPRAKGEPLHPCDLAPPRSSISALPST